MFIRDLEGNEYFLEGVINYEQDLNGDERVDIDIHYTNINKEFLNTFDDLKMWIIIFENKEYRIISSKIKTHQDKFYISCTAILNFLDWMKSQRIYPKYEGSMTASRAFNLIFVDSPYTYVLVDRAEAQRFEGLGDGDTKLSVFKTFLNRYGYEMRIEDKVVYLESRIGVDTNFEYRYKLNATNLSKEIEASDMSTYIVGFGNYEDGEENVIDNAKLKRDYTSPLSKIPGIGLRHAEPVKDGRIKHEAVLDNKLRNIVDNSVNISFSADIYDMSEHGYNYQNANVGDRVFLVDERINLDIEIRVTKIRRRVSSDGRLLDVNITFGNKPLSETYKSKIGDVSSKLNEIISGHRALPFAALDKVSQSMLKKIQSASSEIHFDNGIHAIDKKNPNKLLTLKSEGILMSTDGGKTAKTALTADGISANALTSGTLDTQQIRILGRKGTHYVEILNDEITLYGTHTRTWRGETHTTEAFTRLAKGFMRFRNEKEDRSLYYSDFGISTYLDGEGPDGEETSGTLMFFDYYYDKNNRGTTLYSTYGNVALKSFNNGIVLDSNKNLYLATGSEGVVKVTTEVNGDKSKVQYKRILAASYELGSSERFKTDIKSWETNALETLKSIKLYDYKLIGEVEQGIDKRHHGVVIERETPDYFVGSEGESVDSYEMISTLIKAVQELNEKFEVMEEKVYGK
ncbi:phage tail spike protein [Staphylococcus xylosus]